jgi:SAM-dependent methyltransferase
MADGGWGAGFWDEFYEDQKGGKDVEEEAYEWYCGPAESVAEAFCATVEGHEAPSKLPVQHVLHVGCGTSDVGPALERVLEARGRGKTTKNYFRPARVWNVDVSSAALGAMRRKFPTGVFVEADLAGDIGGLRACLAPSFADSGGGDMQVGKESTAHVVFDAAFDKSTIDALVSRSVDTARRVVANIAALLRPGGIFVCISGVPWARRAALFNLSPDGGEAPPPEDEPEVPRQCWRLLVDPAELAPTPLSVVGAEVGERSTTPNTHIPVRNEMAHAWQRVEVDITLWIFVLQRVSA